MSSLESKLIDSMKPKVSIGVPVYNASRHIREALDSLLSQDYPNYELIISDNASTDNTEEICREYAKRDARINYHRSERNEGAVWNFQKVFELSSGEYFMWAAHDDLWHPRFVSSCVDALEKNPQAVLCHSYTQPVTLEGEPHSDPYVGYDNVEPSVRLRWRRTMRHWELHAAIYGLMRRAVVAQVRPLQCCMCADFVFIAELSLHGQFIQVPEILAWKRVPPTIDEYRTREETLELLGNVKKQKNMLMIRFGVLKECLRGLKYAKLENRLYKQLYRDTCNNYFTARQWLTDVKEGVAIWMGPERYSRWVQPLKATPGKGATNR